LGTHMGEFLKVRREERGWTLGDVARRLGYANLTKGARRVHLTEEGESLSPDLLPKLAHLLGIAPGRIEELHAQDRQEYVAAWERWADEPVPIQIVVRCIPGVFGNHAVPAWLKTPEEMVTYAQEYARRIGKKVFVVLSRRVTVSLNEAGEVTSRHEATPDDDPRPCMRVGNKQFVLPFAPAHDPAHGGRQQTVEPLHLGPG
jgi:transcriptional regulator with XRE-family HTH domain